jgi:hypothetical protein
MQIKVGQGGGPVGQIKTRKVPVERLDARIAYEIGQVANGFEQ